MERTAIVWEAVRDLDLPTPATVVDIGGGTGGFAVRLAELGHRVTVVDPSPDALAAAGRRAREREVADQVTGVQGDLGDLLQVVGEGSADLVLCHGVLGLVDAPDVALDSLRRALRPGGALSLVVGQRHAVVLARAMAGHFRAARAALDEQPVDGEERRFTAAEITSLLTAAGLVPTTVHGVRVLGDLVPVAGAGAELLDLERAMAHRPEYFTLAAALHVVARR